MNNLKNIIKYTQKLHLLYVEDNENAREATLIMLEEFFDTITVAVDGEDGLEKFNTNKIDLIITDINMPNLNGLQMTKKIKKINENIPIVILSAHNESEYFIDSIKLGIDGYLLKPIDMSQFMKALKKIIKRFKLEDEAAKNLYLLEQYQSITDKSLIVSKTNLEGVITYVNDKFCEISGYRRDELIGKKHNIIRHPECNDDIFSELWKTIKDEKELWQGILKNATKYGKSYYVQTTIKPILDIDNNIVEYLALLTDITEIMNPNKQLSDFVESVDNPIVVRLKLQEFSDIENIYGHKMALSIEENFSKKLFKLLPNSYVHEKIFVLGNGEYAFAKDNASNGFDTTALISEIKSFQDEVNKLRIDVFDFDYEVSILISFGFGNDVLENTKIGIKKLLETKKDFIVSNDFSVHEYKRAQENINIIKMVKKAIENCNIVSYFQPIINNETQKIEKYESLVRLINEEEEVLGPFYFLETSKKGKYYTQITSIILENSFSILKNTLCDISINLSIIDIENEEIRLQIYDLLQKNKQNMHRVVFELLEDEDVKDFALIENFITHVKNNGAKIAIDDFGSGYSNFGRLLDYKPDILKIDGSLIKNIETSEFSLNVVKTIVSFAKEQNIKTVGEYVENEKIFNILRDLGVDYSQGYYFGKPKLL